MGDEGIKEIMMRNILVKQVKITVDANTTAVIMCHPSVFTPASDSPIYEMGGREEIKSRG